MSGKTIAVSDLNMLLIKADIITAGSCLTEASSSPAKMAKYLRGVTAFHLQQASEKLIKIQLYANLNKINYHKIYKHSLADLLIYAEAEGISVIIPRYIEEKKSIISAWVSEGRYDTHVVVRTDTLIKCLEEVETWFEQMKKAGYR
ncbi:MAG: HEPN domain-containing protein [Lachnospiraceae bacterium]|nr:HEPN domain-containing protein [Lachnospiraceae bacterium]